MEERFLCGGKPRKPAIHPVVLAVIAIGLSAGAFIGIRSIWFDQSTSVATSEAATLTGEGSSSVLERSEPGECSNPSLAAQASPPAAGDTLPHSSDLSLSLSETAFNADFDEDGRRQGDASKVRWDTALSPPSVPGEIAVSDPQFDSMGSGEWGVYVNMSLGCWEIRELGRNPTPDFVKERPLSGLSGLRFRACGTNSSPPLAECLWTTAEADESNQSLWSLTIHLNPGCGTGICNLEIRMRVPVTVAGKADVWEGSEDFPGVTVLAGSRDLDFRCQDTVQRIGGQDFWKCAQSITSDTQAVSADLRNLSASVRVLGVLPS